MANLFSSPTTAAKQATKAMGIQMQGSQYGPAIPVLYGRNKTAGNCLWYGDFQAIEHQQNVGGKGGGATSTSYTYSASFQLGLCEGPIVGVRTIYAGTSTISASQIGAVFATGAIGQAPWSHLSSPFDLGYSHTALFSVQNLALGSSASLPNYNFEVDGLKQFSSSIPDANPADILTDICTDTEHGIGFYLIGDLTQYSDYCVATGLFLSPVYAQQQSANQALSDLFKWTNTYAYFSEGYLKVVPLGDQIVAGNGVTYTPNVTPVVDLGPDDLLVQSPTDPPVQIDRSAPADAMNIVRVEFQDRSQSYHTSGVVASIDDDVITNGSRADQSVQIDACTDGNVARFIAQNMVQRAFFVRNTYTFRLGWRYCYLEPTDIVTLTDATTGLNLFPVRITQVEEDDQGTLTITAEEFPEGIGHSASYAYETPNGTIIDTNVDPGAVNSPFLFRGPGFLLNGSQPEIWCAVNGSGQYWAGSEVYLSYDGTTYDWLGTYTGGARYGFIESSSSLPVGADPDTTNTPTVQLNAPGTLTSVTQTDADNFNTLAIVDSEIISYETAALQTANAYQLSYLRRGGYGSAIASHAALAPFARLDDKIIRIPVDPSLIGTTVYLKFLSINSFGRTPRTLADETAYTYVVGTNEELPDVPLTPASFASQGIADGVSLTWTNPNPAAVSCTSIERSTTATGPWTVVAQLGPTTTGYTDHFKDGSLYYYRARARGPLVSSGWSAYTSVVNSAGTNVTSIQTTATATSQGPAVQNPRFVDALNVGWTYDVATGFATGSGSETPWAPCQTYLGRTGQSGTPGTYARNVGVLAVVPGQNVIAQVCISNISANSTAYAKCSIEWLDSSGAYLSYTDAPTSVGPGGTVTTVANSRATGQAPSGAFGARLVIGYYNHTSGVITASVCTMVATQAGIGEIADDSIYGKNVQMSGSSVVVPNSMFQLPVDALGDIPGWTPITGGASVSTASFTLGHQSIILHAPTTAGAVLQCNQKYKIKPGDSVWVGGYLYPVSGAACSVAAIFFAADGTGLGNIQAVVSSGGWQYATISGPAPANAAYFVLQARLSGSGSGTTYAYCNEVDCRVNDLRVAGSGARVGDQRNLPAVNFSNYGSGWNGLSLSYSATTTSATISASAATLQAGSVAISYNASSVTVSGSAGTTATYYLYYQDPNHAGGSQTLYATTNQITSLSNDGNVYLAAFSVTFPTSGTGSGTGLGGCPLRTAWVIRRGRRGRPQHIRAGKVRAGDWLLRSDGEWAEVTYSKPELQPCVRIVADGFGTLGCSISAPLQTVDGQVLSREALGRELIVQGGSAIVSDLRGLGDQWVQHITLSNAPDDFYLVGDAKTALFAHHNLKAQ